MRPASRRTHKADPALPPFIWRVLQRSRTAGEAQRGALGGQGSFRLLIPSPAEASIRPFDEAAIDATQRA